MTRGREEACVSHPKKGRWASAFRAGERRFFIRKFVKLDVALDSESRRHSFEEKQ